MYGRANSWSRSNGNDDRVGTGLYTRDSLRADIVGRFGKEARSCTCAAEAMTPDQLIPFREARGKCRDAGGRFHADIRTSGAIRRASPNRAPLADPIFKARPDRWRGTSMGGRFGVEARAPLRCEQVEGTGIRSADLSCMFSLRPRRRSRVRGVSDRRGLGAV